MRIIIYFITLTCLITGCKKKDNTIIDPSTEISFSIEKTNSDKDYGSEIQRFSLKQKSERWSLNTFEELSHLSREIIYDVELQNGETIVFGFDFKKGDSCIDDQSMRCPINKEEVILEETNSSHLSGLRGKKWNYIDTQVEIDNFYKTCALNILIDNNVIFSNFNSENVQLIKLEKAIVEGEEKTYAEFNFEGTAFGWFDPDGKFSPVYHITNGSFKGILE